MGELGQAVAQAAQSFGMKTVVAERKGQTRVRAGRVSFDEVLIESDVLTLHCPLNESTKNLINTAELKMMKPSAVLINVARGGVVNEAALKQALISGEISGAGIDVLTQEPPTTGNTLLDDQIPNLIITPHNAWASIEAQQRLLDIAAENIKGFQTGKPKNVVV